MTTSPTTAPEAQECEEHLHLTHDLDIPCDEALACDPDSARDAAYDDGYLLEAMAAWAAVVTAAVLVTMAWPRMLVLIWLAVGAYSVAEQIRASEARVARADRIAARRALIARSQAVNL